MMMGPFLGFLGIVTMVIGAWWVHPGALVFLLGVFALNYGESVTRRAALAKIVENQHAVRNQQEGQEGQAPPTSTGRLN